MIVSDFTLTLLKMNFVVIQLKKNGEEVTVTPCYLCSYNNTLEVRWPTDLVFTEDVTEIPTKTRDMLTKAVKNALKYI